MSKTINLLTRREFLKTSLGAFAGTALISRKGLVPLLDKLSASDKLGRICIGGEGAWFDIKEKPDIYSKSVGTIFRDDVIPWYREVAATGLDFNSVNQRWVETEGGYINAGYVQPVKNIKNLPIDVLPAYGTTPGMWVKITVPVSELILDGAAGSYWMQHTLKPRAYYGQIYWADSIKQDENGKTMYRMTQRVGCQEEYYWTDAESCKPLTPDDISPISPNVEDKKVVVNLKRQTLSCFENGSEVYFCRVSTGPKTSEGWSTTPGDHPIWRKSVSMHMSANGTYGEAFDTPGIGWATLFTNSGAAVHTAYWHNEFGFARSHGCVNCLPEDAQFVWRWTTPQVQYDPGDLIWTDWQSGSSRIIVNQE